MATGAGNLPHTPTYVSPFDIITSQAENETQDNIVSLADGSGQGDGSVLSRSINWPSLSDRSTTDANGWRVLDMGAYKKYTRRYGPYSAASVAGSGAVTLATLQNFPDGVAPSTVKSFNAYIVNTSNNSSQLAVGIGMWNPDSATTPATHDILARNLTTATLSFTNLYVYVSMDV